jgi:selT/selW/selH-like putative selenoprotein
LKEHGRAVRELRLVPSSGGAFEVSVDGRALWSKKRTKAFPEPGQIAEALKG